jgi:P pilus assembly chaperone PapD
LWHRTDLPNPEGIARLLNRIHARLLILMFVPVLLAPGPSASFSLKPSSATIDAHARAAEFEFTSLSARPTVFQVQIEPAKDFIVVPDVFLVEPYETETFRIALRAFALPVSEESYKVTVVEVVPDAATPPPSARRYTATLVLARASAKP